MDGNPASSTRLRVCNWISWINDFAHRAPGKIPWPPPPQKAHNSKEMNRNISCWWNVRGYLPGVCGWDLRLNDFCSWLKVKQSLPPCPSSASSTFHPHHGNWYHCRWTIEEEAERSKNRCLDSKFGIFKRKSFWEERYDDLGPSKGPDLKKTKVFKRHTVFSGEKSLKKKWFVLGGIGRKIPKDLLSCWC